MAAHPPITPHAARSEGNALIDRALAVDLTPEAPAISSLITGDRSSFLLLMGTIGLPDVRTILVMLDSRGLLMCSYRSYFNGCIAQLLQKYIPFRRLCGASWARCTSVCEANVAHFLTVSTNLYASEQVVLLA